MIGKMMTSGSDAQTPKRFGRPEVYPLKAMQVGDTLQLEAPTQADTKRIHRAVSQHAERHGRGFRGKMDRKTRIITFTRIR